MPPLSSPSPAISARRRIFLLAGGATHLQTRTFLDARVRWVRDRALDHAVEREKHLVPFLRVKDRLLSSPPPHSLPLSSLSDSGGRTAIPFPFRPIRFIRLFPSAFSVAVPAPPLPPHPLISPTQPLISLHDSEAQLAAASRADIAGRLLRLLMLSASRRLPLHLLDRLRLDLGLPADFPRSLLPLFPDYFAISDDGHNLEVVCYRKDLAVSVMEEFARRTGGYKKGDPLSFPLSFPRGFDLEKKVRKWIDEWQKLPYLSPYEDGSHLAPRSDLAEKRTVAALHEALCLTIGKKMEKESLVKLGECFKLPPGFRKVIAHHPGIFYVSNKLRTQTVVLREAYRRHMLVERHPLMGLRYQYLHLMHLGKEDESKDKRKGKDRKSGSVGKLIGEEYGVGGEEEEDEDFEEEKLSMDEGVGSEDEESDDDDDEGVDYSDAKEIDGRKNQMMARS